MSDDHTPRPASQQFDWIVEGAVLFILAACMLGAVVGWCVHEQESRDFWMVLLGMLVWIAGFHGIRLMVRRSR